MTASRRLQAPPAARTGLRWTLVVLTVLVAGGATPARAQAPAFNIYQLQVSGPALNWESPHQGEIVKCTGGIVTHKFRQRIILQDPSLGSEWAAIEVRGYPVYPTGIAVGDQVDFDNVYVEEYRGVTTLQYYSASSHVVHSSGHPLPPPLSLSDWTLRFPADLAATERYASMLVALNGPLSITDLYLGAHLDNYSILGPSGQTVWGSDYANTDIDSTFYVSAGTCYGRIVGIVQRYAYDGWDYYQLLPRMIDDYLVCNTAVNDDPRARGLRLEPICPNPASLPVTIGFELARGGDVRLEIFDVTGRRVALLADGWREPGVHAAVWRDLGGAGAAPGAGGYYARLSAGGASSTRGVRLIR